MAVDCGVAQKKEVVEWTGPLTAATTGEADAAYTKED